ncbi:MAG: hypothetical protein Q7O12_14005 [Deltaproteobacteria bacterium]|nr:hypothetical protein [Deltaproteobacteria bacterium]
MANNWSPPEGHPISLEKAKRLLAGDLGDVLRKILMDCCVALFWFQRRKDNPTILHNGTVTLVQTPKKLLGITAAHILRKYEKDRREQKIRLQLADCVVDDIFERVIAISDRFDIATFEFDRELLANMCKDMVPLESWPPQPPQEGRGIMLAGFPGKERLEKNKLEADFGLFTALGIARIVNDRQITWAVDREYFLKTQTIKNLSPNYDLGGISGGPLISWFETSNYISYYKLSGIITEANATLETVVASRAECINEDGTIVRGVAFI